MLLPRAVGSALKLDCRAFKKLPRKDCSAAVSASVLALFTVAVDPVDEAAAGAGVWAAGAGVEAAVVPPRSEINRTNAAFKSVRVSSDTVEDLPVAALPRS